MAPLPTISELANEASGCDVSQTRTAPPSRKKSPVKKPLPLTLGVVAAAVLAACSGPGIASSAGKPGGVGAHGSAPTGLGSTPTSHPVVSAKGAVAREAKATTLLRCPKPSAKEITAAPGRGKTVALTFDDGPGPFTLQIARTLKANGVNRATFFDTGRHDAQYASVARKVAAIGFLIGDHTWDHRYPRQVNGGWTLSYLHDQIGRTAREQQLLTGVPTCFFRPPGGNQNNVLAAARREGMSVVMWSVDSYDWQQPDRLVPAFVARTVRYATLLNANVNHPIVLMHAAKASYEPDSRVSPYRGNTIAALPQIIAWYRAHGYTFVDLAGRS